MLHLVPKLRFEEACAGKKPDSKIDLVLENSEWPYYESDNGSWLLVIPELKIGLVFGDEITDFKIVYNDWNIKQVSEVPNPVYILNIMKRAVYIEDDFYKTCGIGDWEITNSRYDYKIEFTIKVSGSYFKQTAIGYPEKLKTPIDKIELRMKDKLIENIAYGIRGHHKESSVGS